MLKKNNQLSLGGMKIQILLIISIILLVFQVKADLPVHCLKHQITGKWHLLLGVPIQSSQDREQLACGHQIPDNARTSYKAMSNELQVQQEFEVELSEDDQVYESNKEQQQQVGKWTMVYDEGFEIQYKTYELFAFSKYYPDENAPSKFKSDCSQTLIGWYIDNHNQAKGCYKAVQENSEKSQATDSLSQVSIVQPKNTQRIEEDDNEDRNEESNNKNEKQSENQAFSNYEKIETKGFLKKDQSIKDNKSSIQSKQENKDNKYNEQQYQQDVEEQQKYQYELKQFQEATLIEVSPKQEKASVDTNVVLIQEKSSSSTKSVMNAYSSDKAYTDMLNHKQIQLFDVTSIIFHDDFKDHDKVANRLNQVNKSWNAAVHNSFAQLNIKQLNKKAGRKKFQSFIQVSKGHEDPKYMHYSREDLSDLPKEFDWSNILNRPRQQKDCGSCYAIATIEMIEARIRKKYNESVKLSPQHALDCNFYNQGCDGGYPYLVEKFAHEFGLVPESCSPYQAQDGSCGYCDVNSLEKIYKVESYKFIGGSYGKSNERAIMEEIMNNGPVVMSFEPAYDFMYYQNGIYHSIDAQDWIKQDENPPEWEKVDHSVLCYGWGESEKGEKYWKLMNSWGEAWGEKGHFRMRRGTDESDIESMGEAADPVIHMNKGSFIQTKTFKQLNQQVNNVKKSSNLKSHKSISEDQIDLDN